MPRFTRTTIFLQSKEVMRLHPDWDDEKVREYLGVPAFDMEVIREARKDLEAGG